LPDKTGWDTLLHVGIASFLKAPYVEPEAESIRQAKAKAAVLGFPWDSTVIHRSGANYGPRALREASCQFISYHLDYGTDIFEAYNLVDCGDIPVIPSNAEKTMDIATEMLSEIHRAGALPILLGGDHSVTIAGTRAASRAGDRKWGLILLDTHIDTATDVAGEKLNHCCPISRTVELPNFDPRNVAIMGCNGILNPREEKEFVEEHGITLFMLDEILERGVREVSKEAVEVAHDGTDAVYVTVDIDVLDAAFAPGTGVPTPGGMTSRELITAIRVIGKAGFDAMDLVEVAPQYDFGNITASIGCRTILEALHSRVASG
jgi:agmatinase